MNLANRISITRFILTPFFVAAIVYSRFTLALAIFIICIASDALDGYIARMRNERTHLGSLLDPIADKFLLISGFITLSIIKDLPLALRFPFYVPFIVITRDFLMIIGFIVIHLIKGRVEVEPTRLGKITTFFQMMSIVGILSAFTYSHILWNITVAITIASGIDYLRIAGRILNETR